MEVACKLNPRYSRVLHDEIGADIAIDFYENAEEQKRKLRDHINSLRKVLKNDEIVVLSPKENAVSCAAKLGKDMLSLNLKPLIKTDQSDAGISYTTIQAFKGLEAPAVILTDIEELEGSYAEALLYVGMSRARINLVLIMHEKCRNSYLNINQQGLRLILGGFSGKS